MAQIFRISLITLVSLLSTTLSFAQEACPPQGVVLLPHPDCTKYVVCDQGLDSLMNCPPDLYFNTHDEIGFCDFPENVPECVAGTRPPLGSTPPATTPTTTRATEPNVTTTTVEPSTRSTSTTTEPELTTTDLPNPNILRNCGETIVANSGCIEYKFEESYDSNELCSFVIRAKHSSSGIIFKLNAHGINATSDPSAINIFTFGENGHIETTHLGPPNPLTETYVSGNIAVVVFRTNTNKNNLGTGFKLSFETVVENSFYGMSGVNLVYSGLEGGELTVPFWENPAYMTSAIVLTANHKKVDSVFDTLRLTFLRENLEKHLDVNGCGFDRIHIFSFLSTDVNHQGTFCSILNQKSVYETTGMFILIFKDFDSNYWYDATATFKWEIAES